MSSVPDARWAGHGLAAPSALRRLAAPVLFPTRRSMRALALASVIANAVIMSTGAAVRLSSSGLGCPDWPQCTVASLGAAHTNGQTTLNTWIEFGNRLLNFPLVLIAGLAFIAALRYRPGGQRRRDLVWLAAALPGGVIAQAVLGGIVVLTKLNPALVSAHFLLSCSITGAAVLLHARCAGEGRLRPVVRADLRLLAALLACVTALMILAGTVVTGTGPLAGNATAHRYHLPLGGVTQLHADIGWFMGALVAALVIGLRFAAVPRPVLRNAAIVLAGLGVQGLIGYIQYFTHLPAGLVWVHVTCAVVLLILVLRLLLSMYEHSPAPAPAGTVPAGTVPAGTGLGSMAHRRR